MKMLHRQSYFLLAVALLVILFTQNSQANACKNLFRTSSLKNNFNLNEYLGSKHFYEKNLALIKLASEKSGRPVLLPLSLEAKLAMIETLSNDQLKGLDFGKNGSFELSRDNIKQLTPVIRKLALSKELAPELLFELISGYFQPTNFSNLKVNDWLALHSTNKKEAQNLLRKRYEAGYITEALTKKLNLSLAKDTALVIQLNKVFLKSIAWLLFPRVPDIFDLSYKNAKEGIDTASRTIVNDDPNKAYLHFEKLLLPRAEKYIYFRWFKKVTNTALATLFAVTIIYQIDAQVFPVEGFYMSRETVVSEILQAASNEHFREHGRFLNSAELDFYRLGLKDVSKWQLLYENRSYK